MERDFKGVWIPKEIWLDTRLTALEKIILMEVDSLDNEESHCYASNSYLAEFCQCTEVKISRAIKKCIDLGLLELVSFDGRTRILKSRLKQSLRQTQTNLKADLNKVNANNKDNNIDNNKKNNMTPPTLEEVEQFCRERDNGVDAKRVFDYYSSAGWKDSSGRPVRNWKQKIIAVWEQNNRKPTERKKVAHENVKDYEKGFDEEGNIIW